MNRDIDASQVDYEVLKSYLKAELARSEDSTRRIVLRSSESFGSWAQAAVALVAEKLGMTLGFIAGWSAALFDEVRSSYRRGWNSGISRGRGEPGHR